MEQPTATSRAHWLVSGRVQGVGFRWFVLQTASRLGLRGDVRNLRDGRVEVRAQGPRERIEALLAEVRRGPAGAHVVRVEPVEADEAIDFQDFRVR